MKNLFWALFLGLLGCFSLKAQVSSVYADSSKTAIVLMETKYGPIKIRLFNQTPLHRDNFLKLAEEGFYDSLLFHRVIQGFMIQGGDPDSRTAKPGQLLGDGEKKGAEWIPAEFNKDLFHKRGVLAAAREVDDKNPEKKSSSCQFYITQGRGPLSDKDLKLY
ncbi:MAG: peptidylprolyl isomerase, partial [Bacteroidia bacterium]